MTDIWRNWIISLLLVGVVSSLVQILTHGGKSEKTVKKCTGIALALVIMAPLPALLKGFGAIGGTDGFYETDVGYENYTKEYLLNIITRRVEENLEKIGIDGASVALDATGSGAETDINFVIVKLPPGVIDENQPHINKCKQIIDAVREAVNLPDERIIIYE